MTRRTPIVVTMLAMVALAATATSAGAAGRYVALGDSFTTGIGIAPLNTGGTPPGCGQSSNSYPNLSATSLGFASFSNASCQAARIGDLSGPQWTGNGINTPQLSRLDGSETFVTIGVGGNDVGFDEIIEQCFTNKKANANPCVDAYYVNETNTLRDRNLAISTPLATAIGEVKSRAPNARIYVVGYPQLLPEDGKGCEAYFDASVPDLALVSDWGRHLNGVIEAVAVAQDAVFVDAYALTDQRHACSGLGTRFIEPMKGQIATTQLHPNASWHVTLAQAIAGIAAADPEFERPTPPAAAPTTAPARPAASTPTTTPNVLDSLTISPSRFRSTGAGAQISFEVGRPGSVVLTISKLNPGIRRRSRCVAVGRRKVERSRRCTRFSKLPQRLTIAARAGTNFARLTDRIGGRTLKPGSYQVAGAALDGRQQAVSPVKFTIVE